MSPAVRAFLTRIVNAPFAPEADSWAEMRREADALLLPPRDEWPYTPPVTLAVSREERP